MCGWSADTGGVLTHAGRMHGHFCAHARGTSAARPAAAWAGVGQREPGWPVGGPVLAHPTLHAGQGPPEDDEYEYSEYSVEDYQDPEAPWGGDGENGGRARRDSGRGRQSWFLLTCH